MPLGMESKRGVWEERGRGGGGIRGDGDAPGYGEQERRLGRKGKRRRRNKGGMK